MAIFIIGGVRATLQPFNLNKFSEEREMKPARHRPLGAGTTHEIVSEVDSVLKLEGTIFPRKWGGRAELDVLKGIQARGESTMVTRGGEVLEHLYLITKLKEDHAYIDAQGYGRKVGIAIEMESTADIMPSGGVGLLTRLFGAV